MIGLSGQTGRNLASLARRCFLAREGSPATFTGSRDVLETNDPEMRPLPVERSMHRDHPVMTVLPRKQAKQLLANVMHIAEAHTAIQGSDGDVHEGVKKRSTMGVKKKKTKKFIDGQIARMTS